MSEYTDHANLVDDTVNNSDSLASQLGSDIAAPFKFTTLAVTHAATSLYNSAVNVGAFVTQNDSLKDYKVDEAETVQNLYGDSMSQFYGEHTRSIDFAGDVLSLVVPGTLAFKLTAAARAGAWGVPRILGAAEEARETFQKGAMAAEASLGTYNQIWSATRSAYGASAVSALTDSVAATSLSYVMLNDSRMFDDPTLKGFVTDTLLGAGIGAAFKIAGDTFNARKAIRATDFRFGKENSFNAPNPRAAASENIISGITSVANRGFTDAAQEKLFQASMTQEFGKLVPAGNDGVQDAIKPVIKQLVSDLGTKPDAVGAAQSTLAFVDSITKVKPNPGLFQQNLKYLTEDAGLLQPLAKEVNSAKQATVTFGNDFANNSFTYDGKTVPLSNEKALELYQRLGTVKVAGKEAIQLDEKGNLVLNLAAKDIHFQGDTFDPNNLIYVKNSKDLQGLKFNGRTAQEIIQESNPIVPGYMNTRTGQVSSDIVPSAGTMGARMNSVGNTMHFEDGSFVKLETLVNKNPLELAPHEADAGFIMATAVGRDKELASRVFKTPSTEYLKVETVPGSGKMERINFGFPEKNAFALQAAQEYANIHGAAPLIMAEDGKLAMINKTQIDSMLNSEKNALAEEAVGKGMSTDEIDRHLNVDTSQGVVNTKNQYSSMSRDEMTQMSHVQLNYTKGPVPREEQLAALTQNSHAQIYDAHQVETNVNALSKYGVIMGKDGKLISGDPGTLAADVSIAGGGADFAGFGGRGVSGGAQNAREFMGSLVRSVISNVTTKWSTALDIATAQVAKTPYDMGKMGLLANYIRSRPAVLSLRQDAEGAWRLFDNKNNGFATKANGDLVDAIEPAQLRILQELQTGVGKEFRDMHNTRVDAMGYGNKFDDDTLYFPPVQDSPYFVQVKFDNGGKAMVHAKSAEDLQVQMKALKDANFPATFLTKGEIKAQKQAEGLFDPDQAFQDTIADMNLKRQGFAGEAAVSANNAWMEDLKSFYQRSGTGMVRGMFGDIYAQDIRNLQQMQQRYDLLNNSTKGKVAQAVLRKQQPFTDAINTMLDRSIKSDYPLLDAANNFVSGVGASGYEAVANTAREFAPGLFAKDLKQFSASPEAAKLNELARSYGIGADYGSLANNLALTRKTSAQFSQNLVSGMNQFFVKWQLGKDVLNTAVNLLSFTITTLPEMVNLQKKIMAGEVAGAEKFAVGIPGTNQYQFSTLKALSQIGKEFLNPNEYKQNWQRMLDNNIVSKDMFEYQLAGDELKRQFGLVAQNGDKQQGLLSQAWDAFGEKSKTMLVTKPNEFLRYAAARLAEEGLQAAGVTDQRLLSMQASQFVKRTQHNFPFAQRPVVFQGPVGSAISLYQTFAFNTIQNIARYAGEGDKGALNAFFGLQGVTFGLQSNPIFHAVNSAIAYREGNENRGDIYSNLTDSAGDWLLYGGASNALGLNLWGRGDITPRNALLLPTEIGKIPLVAQTAQAAASTAEFVKRAAVDGVPISQAFLTAVQQSGISRPMAGIASILAGQTVDQAGNKVNDTHAFELATLGRVLGGRPFDEQKLIDLQSRITAYKLHDRAKTAELGEGIKAKIQYGQDISGTDLQNTMDSYVRGGGNPAEFKNWLKLTTEKADSNIAVRLKNKYSNDPDVRPWMDYLQSQSGGN